MLTVPDAVAAGGAPVAVAIIDDIGAVLRVEPGGPDDDGWPQACIGVYDRRAGTWQENGGGGFDWPWPVDYVPDEDEPSPSCFGTPLQSGDLVCFIPHNGPGHAALKAVVGHVHEV